VRRPPANNFAVELSFNPALDAKVRATWATLVANGLLSPTRKRWRPHITLGVSATIDLPGLRDEMRAFASKLRAMPVALAYVGSFPGIEGVIFFGPVVRRELLDLHRAFHARFARFAGGINRLYLPDSWVPHCTIETGLPPVKIARALKILRDAGLPFRGHLNRLAIVEIGALRELAMFRLSRR
jgi:2'-5' RNA ligase